MLTILFELKISRVAVQKIHKNGENGSFSEELLSESDFEAVLASFCCCDYGAKAWKQFRRLLQTRKAFLEWTSIELIL